MKSALIRRAVAAALATLAAGAQATGFQLEQNASGLGNAYSGQAAAAENASTVYYNPAGMTRLPGAHLGVVTTFIGPSVKFSDAGGSAAPGGLPSPGGNGGEAGDWTVAPKGYFSYQVNDRVWLGVGLTVPFGLKTDYSGGWLGRFQSRRAELKTLDLNPSVAFRVSDAVSLGAGISYQKADIKVDRSTFLGIELPTRINLEDESWGYNLGALVTLSPRTRIGVTYRSRIKYDLAGNSVVTGVAGPSVHAPARLPDTISWGIAHQLAPKWELLGDVTYTRWSSIKGVPVVATSASPLGAAGATLATFDFQFRNAYRVGVGANWLARDDFMLKFGVAYDRSPVDDLFRTVVFPDSDRIWLAFGGKYRMSRRAALDFGYAHLFMKDATVGQLGGLGLGGQGDVVGNYDNMVNIFSIQYSHSF
jgi:long-chain fatty acid transport protein